MNRRGIPAAIRCGAGIPTCCLAGFQTCLAVGESRRSGTGYGSARGPSAGQSDRNVCPTSAPSWPGVPGDALRTGVLM